MTLRATIGRFDEVLTTDAVVVGMGVAGLTAALDMAPRSVVVLSKGALGGGSTARAQGGIAAAVGPSDSPEAHASDTVAGGGGIHDAVAVAVLTTEGPQRVNDLIVRGALFDRIGDDWALGREAGHSLRRILHANGDATGAEVSRALVTNASAASHVTMLGHMFASDLVGDAGRVIGLTALGPGGSRVLIVAQHVVLATGGIGHLYSNTTNPDVVTGDGLAMAARVGAAIADAEFVQFHPTALATGRDPMSLLTEALRGEGAVLVDDGGQRFMLDEHPDAELAPRDIVARAIWRRRVRGERIFLDARQAVGDAFPDRFPTVFALAIQDGVDPRVEAMPAEPAAHYHMGGLVTDLDGRASMPGLWAVGEAARTGVHGANRLASNSLLEGLVFGARAGHAIAGSPRREISIGDVVRSAPRDSARSDPQPDLVQALREVMWERVGVVRTQGGLVTALEEMDRLGRKLSPGPSEVRNMLTVARLVATTALMRTESRGAHYRADHPDRDPAQRRSIVVNG